MKYLTSTRDGDVFEADMRGFLSEDGVEGVDVVLNSLTHDRYVERSVGVVRRGGRFVEIGKRGIWTPEQMEEARPDIKYYVVAIDHMLEEDPASVGSVMRNIVARLNIL